VACGEAVLVEEIRPVRDQAASGDEEAFVVDCGQFVPGGEHDDQIAMTRHHHARRQDKTAIG
jgi:hypothetical protein